MVRCNQIVIMQRPDGTIILRHLGKLQETDLVVSADSVERWALRQMRKEVFA